MNSNFWVEWIVLQSYFQSKKWNEKKNKKIKISDINKIKVNENILYLNQIFKFGNKK